MWEVVAREIPFKGKNGVQVSVAVVSQGLRPQIPLGTPAAISNLIQECWNTTPDIRPGFTEILQRLRALQFKVVKH